MTIRATHPTDVREEREAAVAAEAATKTEAQAFFTAVMTDTYIEDEDDEEVAEDGGSE